MSKFLTTPLLLLIALLLGACASPSEGPTEADRLNAEIAMSLGEHPSQLVAVSTGVWFSRYEPIGQYDTSLYQLEYPGLAPEGLVVVLRNGIGFSAWAPKDEHYLGVLKLFIDDIAFVRLEDDERVLTVKSKDGPLYVFQLGGARVDTNITKAFALTIQSLIMKRASGQ